MKPHELKPAEGSRKRRKRMGRGEASGHGKTAGRGTKGTKARGEVPHFFEGGQMPLIRRVPKLKGFTPPRRKHFGAVNLATLNELEGSDFGPDELRATGIVHKRDKLIKVLGEGDVDRAITVRAHAFSESAKSKIEAAGGTVEVIGISYEDTHRKGHAKKGQAPKTSKAAPAASEPEAEITPEPESVSTEDPETSE